MQSSRALFEAAAPLLGKRGSRSEREENFEHLRRHWLESASASPTTPEGKKERKKHTDIIKRMRQQCPEAVDFMLTTPSKAQRALVEKLEALATPEGIARAAAASMQEMEETCCRTCDRATARSLPSCQLGLWWRRAAASPSRS